MTAGMATGAGASLTSSPALDGNAENEEHGAYLNSLRSAARGQLVLKSRQPLPAFTCAIPVPPASASVQQLRSAVVAVLTGQLSARASSSSSKKKNGSSSNGESSKALSYSEQLKEETIREWRMSSIVLELRQNEIIAPETRNSTQADDEVVGFELLDKHDCALLEHGDEIFIKIKQGHSVESLRLPQLSSNHRYGIPDAASASAPSAKRRDSGQASTGLLTAQGRMAAQSHDADPYNFVPPSNPVLEPSEPSSHSSSVSANPQVQYMTKLRHQAGAGGIRVIGLNDISHHGSSRAQPVAAGVETSSPPPPPPQQPAQTPVPERERRPSMNQVRRLHSYQTGSGSGSNLNTNGLLSMQPFISDLPSYSALAESSAQVQGTKQPPPRHQFSSRPTQHRSVSAPMDSPQPSPPLAAPLSTAGANDNESRPKAPRAKAVRQASSSSKVDKQEWERQRKAGQRGMPSDALVIGPGVQGRIGPARMASYDSKVSNSDESGSASGNNVGYGNLDAFVSFTKASGEVQARPTAEVRNHRSASNGKGSMANNTKPVKRKDSSEKPGDLGSGGGLGHSKEQPLKSAPRQKVELPTKPVLPPIRNLSPFATETEAHEEGQQHQQGGRGGGVKDGEGEKPFPLLLASTLSPVRSPTEASTTAESASTGARGSLEPSNVIKESTNRGTKEGKGRGSNPTSPRLGLHVLNDEPQTALPGGEIIKEEQHHQGSGRSKKSDSSRADRRFAEVQRALQAEKERQDAEDAKRLAKMRKKEEEKAKEAERKANEAREKREAAKWSMWEEVRKREAR